MKKKAMLSLLSVLTAGSVLLFSGCGTVDLTTINEEETTLSAEIETEDLSDGTLQVHSVWYDAEQNALASATVTFSDESGEIISAATDDSGSLESSVLPGNTVLTCEITDSTGEVIASSEIVFKISSDYTDLTIYTASGEEETSQCVLEIPADQTDLRAAIFLTEDGQISFANLTPWSDSYETDESEESADDETSSDEETTGDEDASSDEKTTDDETTSSDEKTTDKKDSSKDKDSSDDSSDESTSDETDTAE
ncbi:MAG: hypothetical protein LUD14_12795 [Clostridiales bacterium]|nr:hypothetical protein [Clostridiales bacterium]